MEQNLQFECFIACDEKLLFCRINCITTDLVILLEIENRRSTTSVLAPNRRGTSSV